MSEIKTKSTVTYVLRDLSEMEPFEALALRDRFSGAVGHVQADAKALGALKYGKFDAAGAFAALDMVARQIDAAKRLIATF